MNLILFDWLSFTSKYDSPENLVDLLGLDPFEHTFIGVKGRYFYEYGMRFGGISIYFGGNNNTVMVDMSGQGSRDFETFSSHKSFLKIFEVLLSEPDNYNVTRLDVAYDDHDGVIDIWKWKREADLENYVTKFSDIYPDYGCSRKKGISLYFGRKKSELFFRCYDKASERGCEPGIHWIRFEVSLKNERATSFISKLMAEPEKGIGYFFFGVVNHYVRFVVPSKSDSNKWRWNTRRFWTEFLECVSDISVYTRCDQEYNYYRMCNFIQHTCGNALNALIELDGLEGLQKLVEDRNTKPNPKYEALIINELAHRRELFDEIGGKNNE